MGTATFPDVESDIQVRGVLEHRLVQDEDTEVLTLVRDRGGSQGTRLNLVSPWSAELPALSHSLTVRTELSSTCAAIVMKPHCRRPQGRAAPGVNLRVIYAAELLGPLWRAAAVLPTPAPASGCLLTSLAACLCHSCHVFTQESTAREDTGTLLSPTMSLESPREPS